MHSIIGEKVLGKAGIEIENNVSIYLGVNLYGREKVFFLRNTEVDDRAADDVDAQGLIEGFQVLSSVFDVL